MSNFAGKVNIAAFVKVAVTVTTLPEFRDFLTHSGHLVIRYISDTEFKAETVSRECHAMRDCSYG